MTVIWVWLAILWIEPTILFDIVAFVILGVTLVIKEHRRIDTIDGEKLDAAFM